MHPMRLLLALGLLATAAPGEVMVTVKIVKQQAGRCTAPPSVTPPAGWAVADRAWHQGENDWEVFWELVTPADPPALGEVTVSVPGVAVQRVIVGKADVAFRQTGDRVGFTLIDNRSPGQQMQVTWRSPWGGYPIAFLHNWAMRRAGRHLEAPLPDAQTRAVKNYLLAAWDVFRQMGDVGPGAPKAFDGELVLMDFEVAATRGHLDYPPHMHLMHYQFAPDAQGRQQWVSRLVPHFYLDDAGRIVRNSYAVLAGRGTSAELGVGEVCRLQDTTGRPVLDLVITPAGLELRRPDGEVWSLRPDPERGAAEAVCGYRGETLVCRAEVRDDPARGEFRLRVGRLRDGQVTESLADGYRYDPFTARVLGKLEP